MDFLKALPCLKFCCFLLCFGFLLSIGFYALAYSNFVRVSDAISTSEPDVGANHTVNFIITTAIPASGKIVITPVEEFFNIPAGFDFTEVDLATSSSSTGPFVDRTLGNSSTSNVDGVTVATGTEGSITITLNSSVGINTGDYVKIKIGTNAVFGATGDKQIHNPTSTDSYKVYLKSYDSGDVLLDRATAMIAIISPVSVTATTIPDALPPVRYNGLPTGVLPLGTTNVSMSLNTNEWAYCRYATTADVLYSLMVNNISETPSLFHSTNIGGLLDGNSYTFYIRCVDTYNNTNTDDYLISFSIPAPGEGEGEGGGSSGGGGATYPPVATLPEVIMAGWAYPSARVVILKDGKIEKDTRADGLSKFSSTFSGLEQGVYTFGVWSEDSEGRRSITDSSTFLVRAGTRTTLSVFLPPTIELGKDTLGAGETLEVFGQTVTGSELEFWICPSVDEGDLLDEEIIKRTTTTTSNGKYVFTFDTESLPEDTYEIKVRSSFSSAGTSEFSKILYFGIGKPPSISFCKRADLNKDGKVNLVDFSILLHYWGTTDPEADINFDGKIDLTDFSIMMYCWTG